MPDGYTKPGDKYWHDPAKRSHAGKLRDIEAERRNYPYGKPPAHEDCGCQHCRKICCYLCRGTEAQGVVWNSYPGFATHLKIKHPEVPKSNGELRGDRVRRRLERNAREWRVAQEIDKLSKHGFRGIPMDRVTEADRKTLRQWCEVVRKNPKARERIYLEAIEKVRDGFHQEVLPYKQTLRALQALIEESTKTEKPIATTKEVCFDPRVALEITKLMWGLNRGYSFVVHILCIYGLQAIVQGLHREGITPPVYLAEVPPPHEILAEDEARIKMLAGLYRRRSGDALAVFGFPGDEQDDEDEIEAFLAATDPSRPRGDILEGIARTESYFHNEDGGEDPRDDRVYEELSRYSDT